jgi:hypothetical protein
MADDNRLYDSDRYCNVLRLLRLAGTEPEKLLYPRDKRKILLRVPKIVGTGPNMLFIDRSNNCRFSSRAMESGIIPLIWLSERLISLNLVRFDIVDGILPVRRLLSAARNTKLLGRFPTRSEMYPAKEFICMLSN